MCRQVNPFSYMVIEKRSSDENIKGKEMKNNIKSLSLLVLLTALVLISGCSSTLPVSYMPSSLPHYARSIGGSVVIKNITDSRSMDGLTYYEFHLDKGNFDKPLKNIVQVALETELKRAGLTVVSNPDSTATPDVFLDCNIMDCKALINEKLFANTLDLYMSLRFRWTDAKTGQLLDETENTERETRQLGIHKPKLPTGAREIEDYGNRLINILLPRVIEKGINAFGRISNIAKE